MFRRWLGFLKDRVLGGVPGNVASLVAVDLFSQQVLHAPQSRLSLMTLLLVLTSILLISVLRINDEIRDVELDRVFSPDRPLPAGRITERELIVLAAAMLATAWGLNLIWRSAWLELLAATVFLVLVTQNYFVPRSVLKNRFLIITLGCPFYYFTYLYAATAGVRYLSLSGPAWPRYWIAGTMLLPLLAFEFARKTVLPHEERAGYETYSQKMGLKPAVLTSLGLNAAHFLLFLLFSAWWFKLSSLFLLGMAVLLSFYAFTATRFLAYRANKGRELGNAAALYSLCFTVLLILGAFRVL